MDKEDIVWIVCIMGWVFAAVVTIIGLSAWLTYRPLAADLKQIIDKLPAGCEFKDLGAYGSINHVVMVKCNGKETQTTNYSQTINKTKISSATTTVE